MCCHGSKQCFIPSIVLLHLELDMSGISWDIWFANNLLSANIEYDLGINTGSTQ